MRNLVAYPITTEEVVECLDSFIASVTYDPEGQLGCGDMRPLLLAKAKEIVLASECGEK